MGVLLTAVLMIGGAAVGVWSERRYPAAAVGLARRFLLVILYVLVPIVIFFNLASASIGLDNAVGIGIGLVNLTLVATLTWFVATRLLRLSRAQTGAVICSVLVANTTYLGYPLTVALLGHDHLSTSVLYDVLVSGPALMLGAFGVAAAFGDRAGAGVRQRTRTFFTRNPPLYAAVLGLIAPARWRRPSSSMPPRSWPWRSSRSASSPSAPPSPRAPSTASCRFRRRSPGPSASPSARLFLAPALLMLLAAPLIDLPSAYRLMSAMPTGINAMVVSHAYGLDNRVVAEAIIWSTAIVIAAALVSLAF